MKKTPFFLVLLSGIIIGPLLPAQGIYRELAGTTYAGGPDGLGTLFTIEPQTGTIGSHYAFTGTAGARPYYNDLTVYNGKFYGMTTYGGAHGNGVIFEWDPVANSYTRKLDFDGTNGASPYGSLALKDGKFYGMTQYGGGESWGVIFEWDPAANTYTKKKDFNDSNGSEPHGSLALKDGKFYGMTLYGGANGTGVIFEWDPATGSYTKKQDFTGTNRINGSGTYGSLTLKDGKFYGMTWYGGTNDRGVIFEWDPANNTYTKKQDFGGANGESPYGSLTLKDGKLYGMTLYGGTNASGVIFEWEPASNAYTKKQDLGHAANGTGPYSSLVVNNGKLYGMTSLGGANGLGVIFEWDPAANTYIKKLDFNGTNGSIPYSSPILVNGKFYGTTAYGGTNNNGVIFEWDPIANTYTKKLDFNGTNGLFPYGDLMQIDGKLYGMTSSGGQSGRGVIFEWDPETDTYTKKHDFGYADGANPFGSLTLTNGKFYGMTTQGGANGMGIIFEWDPATGMYAQKHDFRGGTNGGEPSGNLTLKDGKLYGMTPRGGSNGWGVIFEWDPTTNTYTKKLDFNGENGRYPYGSLSLANGKLYGMTPSGGANNRGVVFEWDPESNNFRKIKDLSAATGYIPYGNLTPLPAPVAQGAPGSCQTIASVTIDDSNNNTWVPIVDTEGHAVAEINANGNNLGQVDVSLYIHDGAPRENTAYKLFLDRNLTISVQHTTLLPGTEIQTRLYIRKSEYQALASGINSQSQPSGITSIGDLSAFRVEGNTCTDAVPSSASALGLTAESWGEDYVFTFSTTSFSTFYFAAKGTTLPVTLLSFKAETTQANTVMLNWSTAQEQNARYFAVERSRDARSFTEIAQVPARGKAGETTTYIHTDETPLRSRSYYRLRQVDHDGSFTYSKIVSVRTGGTHAPYPNPAANGVIRIESAEGAPLKLSDLSGREIPFTTQRISEELIEMRSAQKLQPGVYVVTKDGTGYRVVVE